MRPLLLACLVVACAPAERSTPPVPCSSRIAMYADADGDGIGAGQATIGCADADWTGWAPTNGDCDDGVFAIHPGAVEVCDAIDNDCDGLVDDDDGDLSVATAQTWFVDDDGDGYGTTPLQTCERPVGTALVGFDCDDTDPQVNPGAMERCNALDDDCDGRTDQDPASFDVLTACISIQGDYDGSFLLSLTSVTTGATYLCDGDFELSVDPHLTPVVDGTYTCTFETTAGWDPELQGTFEGEVFIDGATSGPMTILDGTVVDWGGMLGTLPIGGGTSGTWTDGSDDYEMWVQFYGG